MPNYDFKNLSPIDFEELTRDLLQKHLGVFLESFKEGKDQGIDLRYSKTRKRTIIIQCKRYQNLSDLKKNLKLEVDKVKKLRPLRYLIVTSVDLTLRQKAEIKNIFQDISINSQDIFGRKDINNLLAQFPQIEKSHYKLWFNSIAILERIIHSSVANRSEYEKEIIERELKIYVSNDSYKEAINILNKNNYVIISGIPGIGKTTLAKMLIYNSLLSDWELVCVSKDIEEAENSYKPEIAQIFYYDDFLGTNFLAELITKNEDKRILKFIERIKKSHNKKLILTTREYILNQAIQTFELLRDKSFEIAKCTIDLKKYTKLIKGKILYNHLYFSEVDNSFINDLIKENKFLKIINHPNYNPRLIQYLTNKEIIGETDCNSYFNFFVENLSNPFRLWEYAYSSHISPISRYLLIILLSLGDNVFKDDLYLALSTFFEKNDKQLGIKINIIEFNKCLHECENTFITIEKNGIENNVINFQNPSIKDYLIHYINSFPEIISSIISGVCFFNQYFEIFSTYTQLHKVFLENNFQKIIFSELQLNFYNLPTSTLKYKYSLSTKDFIHERKVLNKIERLEQISEFFILDETSDILKFIMNEFGAVDTSAEIDNYFDIYRYINITNNLNNHIELNKEKILDSIFTEKIICSSEELKEAIKIKEVFPAEYDKYHYKNKATIDQLIESVVTNEYDNLSLSPTIDDIGEFTDLLSLVKKEFDLDFNEYHELIGEKLNDLEDAKDEVTKKIKSISPTFNESNQDDEVLINIFSSLKYKK